MSIRGLIRSLASPEGPFSKVAKPLRRIVVGMANLFGVGLYEISEENRVFMAQWVASHKDECLFLLHRIHGELARMLKDKDEDWSATAWVLTRLFGERGYRLLMDAGREFQAHDVRAVERAVARANVLAAASFGDRFELRELPEYGQAIEHARSLGVADEKSWEGDDWLAFWGMHFIWFGHLLIEPGFGEWLIATKTATGLVEAATNIRKKYGVDV
jgi:hypothetical protein